jgi:hypothetical protein
MMDNVWARRLLQIVLLTLVADTGSASLAQGFEAAINTAGRQRMLSQKLVMEYCQIGLGVLPEEGRATLAEATREFERNMERLDKLTATHAEVAAELADVRLVWDRFKPLLDEPPTLERARRLNYISEDLLYVSNKVAILLQDLSNRPVDRLVNLSGRQRMLSQRLAKLYLLRSWGIRTLSVRDDLLRAQREFGEILEALRLAPENSPDIAGELDAVILQWEWFRGALAQGDYDRFQLVVVDASETILRSMDQITDWYEDMARRAGTATQSGSNAAAGEGPPDTDGKSPVG